MTARYRWFEVVQVNLLRRPRGTAAWSAHHRHQRPARRRAPWRRRAFENLVEASPDVIGTIDDRRHPSPGSPGRPRDARVRGRGHDRATRRGTSSIPTTSTPPSSGWPAPLDRIDSVNPIAVRASHADGSWVLGRDRRRHRSATPDGGIGGLDHQHPRHPLAQRRPRRRCAPASSSSAPWPSRRPSASTTPPSTTASST